MTQERFGRRDLSRFGEAVRHAREQKGLTQQEAALASGMSPRTLGQIESGRTSPSLLTAVRIAETLGVSLETLVAAAQQQSPVAVVTRAVSADDAEEVDLTGNLETPSMAARLVRVPAGSVLTAPEEADDGASFALVLEGRVAVRMERGEPVHLERRDSYHARPGAVRGWANTGRTGARLLHICSRGADEQ